MDKKRFDFELQKDKKKQKLNLPRVCEQCTRTILHVNSIMNGDKIYIKEKRKR